MEITTIFYLVIAFAFGAIVVHYMKKKQSENLLHDKQLMIDELSVAEKKIDAIRGVYSQQVTELQDKNSQLIKQLSDLEKQKSSLEKNNNNITKSLESEKGIKAKYEALLKEAKEQCANMDLQLKEALGGNISTKLMTQLSEIEQLKKKVKNLEEELEESEDDISDLKKKVKSKESELAKYQDELWKERKASKEMQTELSFLRQELEVKIEELKLKMNSLEFIQEILSAKQIKNEDYSQLNKKIDVLESFVKGQLLHLQLNIADQYGISEEAKKGGITSIEDLRKRLINEFDQWAAVKRKSWLDGKTTIAFVGEFSAGKTSIVNRILSQDNPNVPLLPVSAKATTAIPTYIAGGPTETYSFISGDGKRKTILPNTFKKVSKEILDQIKGVSSLIKYFVMTYKNPNLNGLSILDTPGFNSNDKEDRDRTIEVINECDAMFWVFDVNLGTVNRSSIEIIKEKLNKPLYVVINKVDTKSESDIKKVEKLIKNTLAEEGLQVKQFIRFSTNEPLSNIMNPIKGITRNTNRDNTISEIKEGMKAQLDSINEVIKEDNDEFNKAEQHGQYLTDQFVNTMHSLQDDCAEAYNIPQWVEHIFSSDRFEMDAYAGNRLRSLLESIHDTKIADLANKFDARVENAYDVQLKWSNLCELKAIRDKINECYEQMKIVSKGLE